ncbi:MAG: DEAD/DEAH box helicase [Eubacteriaceae bacterium]
MNNKTFKDYNLSDVLLQAIKKLNFSNPTPVQAEVIPVALENRDILCKAQTGSGKTAAFGIPICENIDWDENEPQALILTPTRELALQVYEDLFNIGRLKRIKVSVLYGKSPIKRQERELKQKNHIVVGTPGRVMDHIERGNLKLDKIKYFIIDEADEMLNMGFIDQVEEIINELPSMRVTMLFSATLENEIQTLSKNYMKHPKIIEIEPEVRKTELIEQVVYETGDNDKLQILKDLLVVENPDSCIIFANTQETVNMISNELGKNNRFCKKIHGGMEQDDRTLVMYGFKKGEFRYLVATDVAARGIDVQEISLVVNFDVPWEKETYVHRIGRTGRRGLEGKAITLASRRDHSLINGIERFVGKEIPRQELPTEDEVAKDMVAYQEKVNEKPKAKKDKAQNLTKEILKLHINAGKKTKMRPVDIVGTLCSIEGITAEDIGIISILDVSTFVEILNNKGSDVLKVLQTKNIKGRLRKVSIAEDKPMTTHKKSPRRNY